MFLCRFTVPPVYTQQNVTDAIISPKQNTSSNGIIPVETETEVAILDTLKEEINDSNKVAPLAINSTSTNIVETNTTDECKNNNSSRRGNALNCSDYITASNELKSKYTVMQYVSGKNYDNLPVKTSGHIRNSLKRKKRSTDIQLDNIQSNSAPEILNYETSHDSRDREILLPEFQRKENLIHSSNLADFNIETLHDPPERPGENNNKDRNDNIRLSNKPPPSREEDDDSRERKLVPYDASEESVERSKDDSREKSHDSNKRLPVDSSESLESEDLKSASKSSDSKESQESEESSEESSNNSKYNLPRDRTIDNDEVDEVHPSDRGLAPREKYSKNTRVENEERPKYSSDKSIESSEENQKPKEEIKQFTFDDANRTVPKVIQDVDLGDFSYERIQVNKDGKVESDTDTYDKDDNESHEEAPINDKVTEEKENPRSEYIEKVNNGEIKPVVEINTENNSNEYSDENVDIIQKGELNTEDTSLESLLGSQVKENDGGEKTEKQVVKNDELTDGNVKQQFERIPLNYKHDKKPAEHHPEKDAPRDTSEDDKDGTLDIFLPKDKPYDDKLHFKFHDVNIKLPEIKLPDDILSYNYESPYSKKDTDKEKNKQRFYHYSDEHGAEIPLKETSIPQYDDDRGYYRYDEPNKKEQYRSRNYRKKSKHNDEDDDDEHVDLYEKFVRERFGKRGSFEKRSEELRNEVFRPSNPKLSETIQHILKRSEATEKEAEKSGDPKAGYMWTLEYGENL